jgi:phage terminase small subunit
MAKDKLTDKQERFCEEYLIDLNATQAAIRAGYSEATAQQMGSENLSKPVVHARIAELKTARSEKLNIDAEWVLKRLVAISDRCMQAEPVMIPSRMGMVHKEDEEGNKLYEFDSNGANKATELIGKHIGFFEKDNEQGKAAPILKIETAIIPAPVPISTNEKEVKL